MPEKIVERITKNEQAIAVGQQKMTDFEEESDARFRSLKETLNRIEAGVDKINGRVGSLERLRWIVLGMTTVVVFQVTAIGAIAGLIALGQ